LRRRLAWVTGSVVILAGLYALYRYSDPERLDLDERTRAAAPGQFVRLTDGYTHYQLDGPAQGRIVVLAAGFSVPYYIWDPTFEALTKGGFRVLRYDYYGRGFSDRPDIPYTQDLYVRQLHELLDATHLTGPINLTGLSVGAAVVTAFAAKYPDRVRTLIYLDPAFRTPRPVSTIEAMPQVWEFLTVLTEQRFWAESQLADFLRPDRFPDWPAKYAVQMQYRGFRRARLSELVSNASVDQGDELKHVAEHPRRVLVIWGKEDRTVLFSESDYLLHTMPRAALIPVEGAGHLPQIEQPEVVNRALLAFLSQ
jgi:pimeloyl-ACP methyl ester carboxylesterase